MVFDRGTGRPLASCQCCAGASIFRRRRSAGGGQRGRPPEQEGNEAMIELRNLTRRFARHTAVDDLSLTVRPGEVLGFLGPNGAGKSTTMKMLTGFLAPTSGTALIQGFDIRTRPRQAQRLIGYLPEGAPCYEDMRVGAFLEFIARVRGYRGEELRRRVARVTGQLQLEQVLGQTIDTLSKGFKRRV